MVSTYVDEAEKEAAKIAPASKSQLLEWIKTASDLIDKNTKSIKKSFEVAEIIDNSDQRSDTAYADINKVMEDVFGEAHMGYVRPSNDHDDPFASCSDDSDLTQMKAQTLKMQLVIIQPLVQEVFQY